MSEKLLSKLPQIETNQLNQKLNASLFPQIAQALASTNNIKKHNSIFVQPEREIKAAFPPSGASENPRKGNYQFNPNGLPTFISPDDGFKVYATAGDDNGILTRVNGFQSDTVFLAGKGNDNFKAQTPIKQLNGGQGDDILEIKYTEAGGTKEVNGGKGNDRMITDGGFAIVTGGEGRDTLEQYNNINGPTIFKDFKSGEDKIQMNLPPSIIFRDLEISVLPDKTTVSYIGNPLVILPAGTVPVTSDFIFGGIRSSQINSDSLNYKTENSKPKYSDKNDRSIFGDEYERSASQTGQSGIWVGQTPGQINERNIRFVQPGSKTVVIGTPGDDNINTAGGFGNNFIGAEFRGGKGNDNLEGWRGDDTLTGGQNADIFKFPLRNNIPTGRDTITDFNPIEGDKIEINSIFDSGFTGSDLTFSDVKILPNGFSVNNGKGAEASAFFSNGYTPNQNDFKF